MKLDNEPTKEELTPGSYQAVLRGCTCPLLGGDTKEIKINKKCPLHGEGK